MELFGHPDLDALSVLVVDDDEMIVEYLAIQLEQAGCTVLTADSAEAALDAAMQGIEMLVTDFRMPGTDGLELVRAIRERNPGSMPLHVVMMTSSGDEATIRRAIEAGVDDFLYKPIEPLQLSLAMASARRAVRMHRQLNRRNDALAAAHDRLQGMLSEIQTDLDAAAGLHERLLPRQERLNGLRVAHVYKPAAMLGGDTIGASDVGGGRTLFFVIDVQGHGVRASLDSFHFHHRLKQMRPTGPDELSRALESLNREILEQESDTYATIVCGILDPAAREGWLVRAGHPAPLLVRGGDVGEIPCEGAFPLGWFADARFTPTRFIFAPRSRLVIYSDGLSDCCDRSGRQLGTDGLERLLADCGQRPIAAIGTMVELALSLRGENPQLLDDVSLLALEPELDDRMAA